MLGSQTLVIPSLRLASASVRIACSSSPALGRGHDTAYELHGALAQDSRSARPALSALDLEPPGGSGVAALDLRRVPGLR